jgi:hypothetical protein
VLPHVLVFLLYARVVSFVFRSVVDVPFMDEWYIWSDLLQAIDSQALSWDFVTSPYNGHRLGVVRLMLLAMLPTHWAVSPQVALTLAVSAVYLGVLWHLYRITAARLGVRVDQWATAVLAALVFSCADINRLWGMGVEWHVVVLSATVCMLQLSAEPFRWWRLLTAAFAAAVASLSVAAGLLVWVVGMVVLAIARGVSPLRARALISWTGFGAVAWFVYLRTLPELTREPGVAMSSARAVESIEFALMYVGLPFPTGYNPSLMSAIGVAGVLSTVVAYTLLWRHRRSAMTALAPWFGLVLFSIGTGALIAAVRPAPHVALYYATTARLFWIASVSMLCLVVAVRLDQPSGRLRRLVPALVVVVLLSFETVQTGAMRRTWEPLREGLLQTAYDAPDLCAGNWNALARVTYPPDALRKRYGILANHHVSFTRHLGIGQLELASGRGFGAIDRSVVELTPDQGPPCVHLSGWAIDPRSGEAASEVLLVAGDKVLKRGAVTLATPQIASRFARPAMARSGWAIFVSQERWPRDASALAVYGVGKDRRRAYRLELAPGVELPFGDLDRYHEYPLGFMVDLGSDRDEVPYALRGFSGPESGARWTDASEAAIDLTLTEPPSNALKLVVRADAFVTSQHPRQRVEILANDRPIAEWTFNLGDPMRERDVVLPAEAVGGTKRLRIRFRLLDAASPANLHLSTDTRLLGIRMARFWVADNR